MDGGVCPDRPRGPPARTARTGRPACDDRAMARRTLRLTGDESADALLGENPLALLIGMVLDQQVPLERAFAAPAELARRLGTPLAATTLAAMDPAELEAAFRAKPALHRYPGSMAKRVQDVCRIVVDRYGGEAQRVWDDAPDGATELANLKALPGFGEQKARIFAALLGKQLGVRPPGWEEAATPFGEPGSYRSIADIVDPASLDQVRAFKQAAKAAAKAAGGSPTPAGGGGRASSRK